MLGLSLIASMTGNSFPLQNLNGAIWFKAWNTTFFFILIRPFFLLFPQEFILFLNPSRSFLIYGVVRTFQIPFLITLIIPSTYTKVLFYPWRNLLLTFIYFGGGISEYFASLISPPLAEYPILEVSSAFVFALGALGTLGGLGLSSILYLGALGIGFKPSWSRTDQCPLPPIFLSCSPLFPHQSFLLPSLLIPLFLFV